jgi:hypothetical protein
MSGCAMRRVGSGWGARTSVATRGMRESLEKRTRLCSEVAETPGRLSETAMERPVMPDEGLCESGEMWRSESAGIRVSDADAAVCDERL